MNNQSGLLEKLSGLVCQRSQIEPSLYGKYDVKRGLRDISGRGVLAGLTEIGEVLAYTVDENELVPIPGRLFYRGVDVAEFARGFAAEGRFGFEETVYLLLFGELPRRDELDEFTALLEEERHLPHSFVRDMIMKAPSRDIMNALARSVLSLYSYDDNPDDITIANVLRQCLRLVASFPLLAVYAYQAKAHYHNKQSLVIHSPKPGLSTGQTILHLLRPDSSFTETEAMLLDLALVLHAEHGGGNNSTFVTNVVTSSATDTYAVMSAALGSLKGPLHGGANIKVVKMFEAMREEIKDWHDETEVAAYLERLLNKDAFDKSGLIYGIGHAVYSVSDPRSVVLKEHAARLAREKDMEEEFTLYDTVERLAPEIIARKRRMYKGVSANVDFYSGFVYRMLDIPEELFTPLFAVARIAGWSAHRLEELVNAGKIVRPAYKCVKPRRGYTPLAER